MFPAPRLIRWFAALAAALLPLLAAADPPARVGRLSLAEGSVLFRTDRDDKGSPASVNWPISGGAILDTEADGRAEVWVGSSAFRLGGGSRVEFAAVDDRRVSLQMAQGSLAVSVRDRDQADDLEIQTPAGEVRFGSPGHYRIDIDPANGDTRVANRDGAATLYRPGGQLAVPPGQEAMAYAAGGWFVQNLHTDSFDGWSDDRDQASQAPTARRYVSPQMTGYDDLDRYGEWGAAADYGEAWYPSAVPAGWAPYRYGRWAWVPPWGWTWVDDAPWGFAPFHYGRWLFIGGRWAWVPGAYIAQPVYAPALVAWIGDPGWSVGFSFGSAPAVGWFPLAPREVFVPAYRCSPTYIHQVNITQVRNVTVIDRMLASRQQPAFVHRNLPQAVTVVAAQAVQRGDPITPKLMHRADPRQLAQAPVSLRAPGHAWLPPAPGSLRPHSEASARFPGARAAPPPQAFLQPQAAPPGHLGEASARRFGTPGAVPPPVAADRSRDVRPPHGEPQDRRANALPAAPLRHEPAAPPPPPAPKLPPRQAAPLPGPWPAAREHEMRPAGHPNFERRAERPATPPPQPRGFMPPVQAVARPAAPVAMPRPESPRFEPPRPAFHEARPGEPRREGNAMLRHERGGKGPNAEK